MTQMMYFKLKPGVGKHASPGKSKETTYYKPGDVVPSEIDLVAHFPNKYIRVDPAKGKRLLATQAKTSPVKTLPPTPITPIAEDDSDIDQPELDDIGEDVTVNFEDAAKAEVRVFKKDELYHLYSADDMKSPINEKPFKTAKKVASFIAAMIPNEE